MKCNLIVYNECSMRKIFSILLVIFFLFVPFIKTTAFDMSNIDDVTKELEDSRRKLELLKQATDIDQAEYDNLQKQLDGIKIQVGALENEIIKKEKEVKEGEKALSYQKNLLNERARSYYKNIEKNTFSLINLLVSDNLSESLKNFFYQKKIVDEDRKTIIKVVMYIKDLEDKKESLVQEKKQLAAIKIEIDKQAEFLSGEISTAKEHQSELSSKIAQLSQAQQSLVSQRQAALNLPRSAGTSVSGCVDDRDRDPGFSPRFAFYTYGSTHRVGMNQYGAYGRAKAGQNYQDILNVYYNNVRFECRNFSNNNIKVQGYGEINIYDYLKGLGEMPESWGNSGGYEALKAQVVAAASFAHSHTNGGSGEICTSESCQVYIGYNKGGRWENAVDDIKGECGDDVKVMVSNDTNEVIKAWYASTHGGYMWTSGEIWGGDKPWTKHAQDTTSSANNFSELNERAWDKESPWFYCDWGHRGEYNNTAWLKSDEVADIANVILLVRKNPGVACFVYQTDKAPPPPDSNKGCPETDNWSAEKVKQELGPSAFNSVNSVSVSVDFGYGKTNGITINGDAGSQNFDGDEFKNYFNVRAPANIQIVGPLYNVEKQ